jgi:hypothetical protein
VREIGIPVTLGVAVAFAWIAAWTCASCALGVPVLMRNPEERAARRQHILQMGKLRYIVVFGLLGNGFGMGLGIGAALMMSHHLTSTHSLNWGEGAVIFGAVALVSGCLYGLRTWRELVPVPFPPVYPPPK